MAKNAFTVRITAVGLRETLAAFRALPKDASAELRDAAQEISRLVASVAKSSAGDPQSQAVAATVRPVRDRVPAVQAGGSQRITSQGIPAYRLLFGSEFGAEGRYGWYAASKYGGSAGRQFSGHTGTAGRWFFPSVERTNVPAMKAWNDAVDRKSVV